MKEKQTNMNEMKNKQTNNILCPSRKAIRECIATLFNPPMLNIPSCNIEKKIK